MSLTQILNLDSVHNELNLLLKCDFREIQKKFVEIRERYCEIKNSSITNTPSAKVKTISNTPSTHFSTPKLTPKRKLRITPQKNLSSKSSRKNSGNQNIDPETIFGRPLKVNLKDIFQGYLSSSEDSKGSL